MPELMGIAAYAEHRNVTENAVRRAIKEKRITCKHVNGRRVIDPSVADSEWEANTLPQEEDGEEGGEEQGPTLLDARLAHQTIKAQLAQIELEEKRGQLVQSSKVKEEAFKVARAVRESLRQIPLKISAEVAAETDPHRVEIILQKEIDEALTELSRMKL